jgi:mannose-6-phosphate isomerase-like protein (cupin superfamily)
MSEAELLAAIKKALAGGETMGAGRVVNTEGYRINLIRRTAPAGAIVHADGHEVHHITEGAATLKTGGTVIRAQGQPGRIEGGREQRVAKGDVVFIPVNTPHQYTAVDGAVSYLEIRFAPVVK